MIEKKIQNSLERIKDFFKGSDNPESKKNANLKKIFNLILVLLILIVVLGMMVIFLNLEDKKNIENNEIDTNNQKIEFGTDGTNSEVKWQNFLEESIETEGKKRQEQIDILKNTISKDQQISKEETNNEFSELKDRLSFALQEIDRLKIENENIQQEISLLGHEDANIDSVATLGITEIAKTAIKAPISSYNHIPATSYVSGFLLGGIVVSTSVNSASEPIPIVIKLTNRGNLPTNFAVDIKQCRVLASAYGDISSERAIIRAEELICENKSSGLITTTKVSGVIYGDDGANGIRGSVVSMSDKHLKNALIGGVLSGFSNTAKGQSGFNITSLGAISTKKKGIKEMAQDGVLTGAGTASEKLADYHIKLAENISPVILIPGGTKVDVMFTKSVEIGSMNIEEVINVERLGR